MAHHEAVGLNRGLPVLATSAPATHRDPTQSARPTERRLPTARKLMLVAAIFWFPLLAADFYGESPSPEGFSVSYAGLPESYSDAWHATVCIEARGVVMKPAEKPHRRTRKGSGIVMRFDRERRIAVVATNAHIITCRGAPCEDLRVGFGDTSSADDVVWTEVLRIVSRNAEKDLAFLEVRVPGGIQPRAARFTSAECESDHADPVISIGWPDLRIRNDWGVAPPPNFRDQIKRYSDGSYLFSLRDFQMLREDNRRMSPLQVVFHNSDVLPGSSGGPLVNRNGDVLGINTMVLRGSRETEQHLFCARRKIDDVGQCMHAAIASIELIAEYESLYSSQLALSGCSEPFEFMALEYEAALSIPSG